MKPIEIINELKLHYANTDIDWELILELGYRLFLDAQSTVVDVGGHAGRHSDVFVRGIGCARVVVFEPLPAQAAFLRDRYASDAGVSVIHRALGAQTGTVDFVFNRNSPEESGLRERHYNDPSGKNLETLQVEVGTLDQQELALSRLDYIKIDTEGGEIDILKGARETLSRFRPVLSVEYGAAGYGAYGYQRSTLFELAGEIDYVLFDLFGHPIARIEDWNECADNYYWDFYGVPSERADAFASLLGPRILDRVPHCLAASARQ